MWERLDSAQLKSDGTNRNNLKEKGFKIQKKKHVDTYQQTPLPHVIKIEQCLLVV